MRLEHRLRIEAPIRRVWDLTIDVEALPEITPTMTKIEMLDERPLGVGSRVRIKQPAQRAKTWTVTELEVGRCFTWVVKSAGLVMAASHELQEVPEGTENTLSVEIEGPLARVLGPLIAIPIRRAIATENRSIRAAAEGSSVRTTASEVVSVVVHDLDPGGDEAVDGLRDRRRRLRGPQCGQHVP